MPSNRAFARLLADVASRLDTGAGIEAIVRSAVAMTGSRYGVLVLVNEDLGTLEVRSVFKVGPRSEYATPDLSSDGGLIGFVISTGASLHVGSADREQYYQRLFSDTKSEISAPVKGRDGRVRGALAVETDTFDAYREEEQEALGALGCLIGMQLEQEQHFKREEALIQIGRAVDAVMTEESLIDRVIQVADHVLRLQACSIFLLDSRGENFVLRGTIGKLGAGTDSIYYEPGEGFTGWVCQTGRPIMLEDPQQDPRWRGKYVEFPNEDVAGFLAVPILSRGRSIGAVRVVRRKSDNRFIDNRFTQDDLRLLQAVAAQLALGLENIGAMEIVMRGERMVAWGELSAKSSHMIGNRVFALKGDINELGHLLKEDPPDSRALEAIYNSLTTGVSRIDEILQDFRDFISATQVELVPTDLNELLRATVGEVFPRRSPVKLEFKPDPELPAVLIDAKRFRRAISELVENSLNYMEEGHLCIGTQLVSDASAGHSEHSRMGGRYAQIEIEDTGPGIEQTQKGHIFEPFFSKRVRGLGLGLSIVKGIVDAHGGEVFESGTEGFGAKFVIRLPLPA